MLGQDEQDWILWQLSDSALPSGGFIASSGLEAASQTGHLTTIDDLVTFIKHSTESYAFATLPYLTSAYGVTSIDSLCNLDCDYDAFLSNHVTKRASIQQGSGFLTIFTKCFIDNTTNTTTNSLLTPYKTRLRLETTPGHLPIIFAIGCRDLNLPLPKTQQMFLFFYIRSLLSSAVRLNLLGPLKSQQILFGFKGFVNDIWERVDKMGVEDAVQTFPVLEILQGVQDRLYSKLFNS